MQVRNRVVSSEITCFYIIIIMAIHDAVRLETAKQEVQVRNADWRTAEDTSAYKLLQGLMRTRQEFGDISEAVGRTVRAQQEVGHNNNVLPDCSSKRARRHLKPTICSMKMNEKSSKIIIVQRSVAIRFSLPILDLSLFLCFSSKPCRLRLHRG